MYHLDGKTCMRNMLDILLTINCIKVIEFTPGAGSLPTYTAEYIPRYRKILENGCRFYSKVWFNTPELCSGSNKTTLTRIWY
jgi:hypothetical protein